MQSAADARRELLRLIEQAAARSASGHRAVVEASQRPGGGGGACSLPRLLAQARRVARAICPPLAAAAPPGDALVGVLLSRGAGLVVALLAALLAGAPFLPLSPDWPPARLATVLESARPGVVLWDAADSFGGAGPPGELPAGCTGISLSDAAAADGSGLETLPEAGGCCYVLPTSGSSGAPKGVCGTHVGLLNRIRWAESALPWQAGDVACLAAAPGFVDCLWGVFGPLTAGVPLVVLDDWTVRRPALLAAALAERGVSHLTAVPTLLQMLAPHLQARAGTLRLRQLGSSGEPLPLPLLRQLRAALPGCRILNLYGCTEAAGDSTCCDASSLAATQGGGSVPAGFPIAATAVFIAGAADAGPDSLAVLPQGEVGQICIVGAGLAVGYHRDAALSASRFRSLPSAALAAARGAVLMGAGFTPPPEACPVFLTGDAGRLTPHGLQVLRRMDSQASIAGVRIVLPEVEAALLSHPAVAAAAAKVWGSGAGATLVGYVSLHVPTPDSPASRGESWEDVAGGIRRRCAALLPAAAAPRTVLVLEQLPQGQSGKLDRGALPPPVPAGTPLPGAGSSSTHAAGEADILALFRKTLGQPRLEPAQDVWAAGADSASVAAMSHALGLAPTLLIAHPSARRLAAALRASAAGSSGAASPGSPAAPRRRVPGISTCAQERAGQRASKRARHSPTGPPHRPEPALGGVLLAAGGGVRLCPPADASSRGAAALAATWRQSRRGSRPFRGPIACAWRAPMDACVDAAPAALLQFDGAGAQRGWAFAASHAGDVACLDAEGRAVWRARLQGPADAGLCLTSDLQVVVVAHGEAVSFLAAADGAAVGSFRGCGAVRACPAADPWEGLVWVAGHAGTVALLSSGCEEVGSHSVGEPMSTPPVFAEGLRLAFMATLTGTVTALRLLQPASSSSGGAGRWQLQRVWRAALGAPVLSTPAFDAATGTLAVAAVSGSLTLLSARGEQLRRLELGSQVCAPLMLLPGAGAVLAGCQSGRLLCVGLTTGEAACVHSSAGGVPISSAAGVRVLAALNAADGSQALLFEVATCSSDGVVAVGRLQMPAQPWDAAHPQLSARVETALPAETFSGPVCLGERWLVGCRDDHLYCLVGGQL